MKGFGLFQGSYGNFENFSNWFPWLPVCRAVRTFLPKHCFFLVSPTKSIECALKKETSDLKQRGFHYGNIHYILLVHFNFPSMFTTFPNVFFTIFLGGTQSHTLQLPTLDAKVLYISRIVALSFLPFCFNSLHGHLSFLIDLPVLAYSIISPFSKLFHRIIFPK